MSIAVGAHFQRGPLEGGHDKGDKVSLQADAFKRSLDATPPDRVIGLGDVIVYGITGLIVLFSVSLARYGRIDGFVDVSPREECELGFV